MPPAPRKSQAKQGFKSRSLDIHGWIEALACLEPDVALRAELRQRGLQQVAPFTWENTARQTQAIYQEVYAPHRP